MNKEEKSRTSVSYYDAVLNSPLHPALVALGRPQPLFVFHSVKWRHQNYY